MNDPLLIRDIGDAQQVDSLFLLRDATRAETRAGKPYLTLKLTDSSGELPGRIWDEADRWEPECLPGRVVRVSGRTQSYRGTLQLIVSEIRLVEEQDVDFSRFIPATSENIDQMAEELTAFARSVDDPFIRKLLLKFINDRDFFERFKSAPAAKSMHHAYLGGLLEHTLRVARLAEAICSLYPSINRSLLLAGAMLHDVGKVEELSLNSGLLDYTDQGRLMGHMVLGVEMIADRIKRIKEFPEALAVRIKHLVISHHGRHEFGSPILPMLHEAFVLNFIDDLDAKINYVERLSSSLPAETYQWSDYQRNLERFLFLSGPAADNGAKGEFHKEKAGNSSSDDKAKQPSLFGDLETGS